jgi:hypothetical protein
MERCPNCGGQAISCGCSNKKFYSKGYRIPWVQIPVLCGLCGEAWPDFFTVPDSEWEKFVPPNLQKEVLCVGCYMRMKKLFPKGWKSLSVNQK